MKILAGLRECGAQWRQTQRKQMMMDMAEQAEKVAPAQSWADMEGDDNYCWIADRRPEVQRTVVKELCKKFESTPQRRCSREDAEDSLTTQMKEEDKKGTKNKGAEAQEGRQVDPEHHHGHDLEIYDPFAMLGGMGAEQIYKVTMVPTGDLQGDLESPALCDPFELLGGMGAEELYKVTMGRQIQIETMIRLSTSSDEDDEGQERRHDEGMGAEEVYKVTRAPTGGDYSTRDLGHKGVMGRPPDKQEGRCGDRDWLQEGERQEEVQAWWQSRSAWSWWQRCEGPWHQRWSRRGLWQSW